MPRWTRSLQNYALPVLMLTGLLLVYLATMAPGISWANGGSDGGDLITAAATRGVAHPTGYPVYLWLAGLFQKLPLGSLAFRTNLLSAVCMVGATLCIYLTVRRSVSTPNLLQRELAAVIAGWVFGTSELAWSQAVITEVYALHAFFVALILYLIGDLSLGFQRPRKVFAIGLVLGLALGNHVTVILLAPGIVFSLALAHNRSADQVTSASSDKLRRAWKYLLRWGSGVGLGVSSYLLLPLWASTRPAVSWGNPVTPGNLWWLVTGKMYQGQLFALAPAALFERLQDWAELLVRQYGALGLLLALTGLVVFFVPNRMYLFSIWTAVSASAFAISYDVIDWHLHLISVYLVFGIWLGFGVAKLFELLAGRGKISAWLLALLCIGYAVSSTFMTWRQVDASRDMRAEEFGRSVMRELPADAIVFVEEDGPVFVLWYFHFALHQRPDISVIASDLLRFDWYRDTLQANYPRLDVPASNSGLWQEAFTRSNSAYPICTVYYSGGVLMNCP